MTSPANDSEYIEPDDVRGVLGCEGDSADIHNQTDEVSNGTKENAKDNKIMEGATEEIHKHNDDNLSSTENSSDEENSMKSLLQRSSEQNEDEVTANGVNSTEDNDSICYAERNSEHNKEGVDVNSDINDKLQVVLEVARSEEKDVVMKNVPEENPQQQEFERNVLDKHSGRADLATEAQNLAEEDAAVQSIRRPKALEINKELVAGSEFPDYLSFKNTVDRYSIAHGITYVTAFSTTVASRNKHCVEPFAECLRFANLRLRCKYGGTQRASTARFRKITTMICRTQCPSMITVVGRTNPDRLRVMSFVEDHNHKLEPAGPLENSKVKSPWGRPKIKLNRRSAPSKVLGARTLSKASARQVVRALSNNLSPSNRSQFDTSAPRSPMVTFRPRSSLTLSKKLLSPLRSSAPPIASSTPIVRRRNARVVPSPRLQQGALLSMDQDTSGQSLHDTPIPGPAFNEEVIIDISDDADVKTVAENVKTTQTVGKVNEAWKCVYNILEEDHRKLRAEVQRLRRENQRLRAATCTKCGSLQA